MKKLLAIKTLVAGMLISASSYALTLHGSTTVKAGVFDEHETAIEKASGVDITVIGNGSSRGVEGLLNGSADIGMISANLETVLKKVGKEAEGKNIIVHQLTESTVAFGVHPKNAVKNLSGEQLQKILLGEIKNWKDVGGSDTPIVVVTEYSGGGIRSMVEKKLLDKKPIHSNARTLPNGTQITRVASQIPQALAVAPLKAIKASSLNPVETDVNISQPLILLTNGTPSADAQKVINAAKNIFK